MVSALVSLREAAEDDTIRCVLPFVFWAPPVVSDHGPHQISWGSIVFVQLPLGRWLTIYNRRVRLSSSVREAVQV